MKTKAMTEERIKTKIAEACGWTVIGDTLCKVTPDNHGEPVIEPFGPLPDYPRDLNVCHEMVMQQPVSVRISINHKLCEMLREKDAYILDRCINATARQRCEAFLRTLNLWEE